ncbi:MAG: efflux RND transporter periplasmic adaptor subunit [Pseudomonadota bacterium]
MTLIAKIKEWTSDIRRVILTAVIALMVVGISAFFLGYLVSPKSMGTTPGKERAESERKIAYWRSPMNPTEIYDKPGKSAMGMDLVPVYEDETGAGQTTKGSERKIAYWRAPMNPTEIYDKPGKSAMGMDLVPVYEDTLVSGVEVAIDPVTQQNMGLRTATAQKETLVHTIRTYGHVTSDETRTAQINVKAGGWIEKLYVDFTGKHVEKGQPLYEIFSPELMAAQEEFLVAFRSLKGRSGERTGGLLESARRRLQYFDVAESEIQRIEESGQVKKTLMIRSPVSGYVIKKNVEEGSFVKAGTLIYRISDLSRVWVEAHIYEYELPWIAVGQDTEMTLSYQPGKKYTGRVTFVYPYLQPKTRDVVIRLEFDNPDLSLKPDMYADVLIKTETGTDGLVIPSEAVIRSGERNVVFVVRTDNKFSPRDVTLGLAVDDGKVQVLDGIAPGETVVSSGQFLLDSESKLKEAVRKMLDAKRVRSIEKKAVAKEEKDFFEDVTDEEDFFKDLESE